MKSIYGQCPYATTQRVLQGKWAIVKSLEESGLIVRRAYSEIPPKVEYELSEIGYKFDKVLAELEIWGNEYIQYMKNNHML